jgi:hypothetical protein
VTDPLFSLLTGILAILVGVVEEKPPVVSDETIANRITCVPSCWVTELVEIERPGIDSATIWTPSVMGSESGIVGNAVPPIFKINWKPSILADLVSK